MMTAHLYSLAANAMLPVLISEIRKSVPNIFDFQGKALSASPALAGELAKAAVDALLSAHGITTVSTA